MNHKKPVIMAIIAIITVCLIYIFKVFVWNPVIADLYQKTAWLAPYIYLTIFLPPVCGLIFVLWAYRKRNPKAKIEKKEEKRSKKEDWKWPLNENATFLIFGWTFLLLLPLFFGERGSVEFSMRDWWWNHITTSVGIFIIIGFTLYGYMMYADPKKPFRYKLGNYGTGILILVSLFYLFGDRLSGAVDAFTSGFSGFGSRSSSETSGNSGHLVSGLGRAETQDIVTKFWYSNLPVIDAREMINIAQAESGFNHFGADGNVLRGVENPDDIGVMQINQVFWGEKARELGYNIDDLHGNLQMALYIRKEKGAEAWTTYKKVVETPEVVENIVAPVGDWSPVQKVKANCIWRVDRTVIVKDDQGREHTFIPGQTLNVITWTFQISVPDEPPGNMELRCTPP